MRKVSGWLTVGLIAGTIGQASAIPSDYLGTTPPNTEKTILIPGNPSGGGCTTSCPPGSPPEGEPVCQNGYVDNYNGGCNSTPNVFTDIDCNDLGVTMCGTYGTFESPSGATRDTDWYRVVLTNPTTLNVCVCGSQPTQLAITNGDCGSVGIVCGSVFGAANEEICCSVDLGAGTYFIFVGTNGFSGFPCGSPYRLTIGGHTCPPVGVEPANWSMLKSIYR